MESLKNYEEFKPLNESVMTLDQIIKKDIRIDDLKGDDLSRLVGSTVHEIPKKKPANSKQAYLSSVSYYATKAANIDKKNPTLYLKDKNGKPLCILV